MVAEEFEFPAPEVKLTQHVLLWGTQSITLDGTGNILVQVRRPTVRQDYTLRLTDLSPVSSKETCCRMMPLACSILLAGAICVLVTFLFVQVSLFVFLGTQTLLIFSLLALIHQMREWRERNYSQELFFDRNTAQPVLALWTRYPSRPTYEHFSVLLKERIEAECQSTREGAPTISEQLEHLRQMLEDGLLDDEEFRTAKRHLLCLPGSNKLAGKN